MGRHQSAFKCYQEVPFVYISITRLQSVLYGRMSRKSLGQMRSFVLGGEKKEGRKTMCEQAEVEKHLFQADFDAIRCWMSVASTTQVPQLGALSHSAFLAGRDTPY